MRRIRELFHLFLSLVLVISSLATGIVFVNAADTTFSDVPDSAYYASAVRWAVDKDITKGTSDTTFSPDAPCTRAQCVTFLYRYAGSPAADAEKASKFTDVVKDSFYAGAVAWAVENGITSGTSETTFAPDEDCTRAQIVTFLWRFKNKPSAADSGVFNDVKNDAYYAEAVSWAVEQNITKGTSDTTFSPDNTCTRAQIVTFLWRLDNPGGDSQTGIVDLDSAKIGDYVIFGQYEQDNDTANGKEDIVWKVLDKKDGRVLLLSKYGLDRKSHNDNSTDYTWETCSLRSWLNSEFLNTAFSDSEKAAIPTVTLSNPDNPIYGTKGGNDTKDQVFLLSLEELQQYFTISGKWTDYDEVDHNVSTYKNYIGGSKDVIASATAFAKARGGLSYSTTYHDAEGNESCWWWLRSSGYDRKMAAVVYNTGGVDAGGSSADNSAVRPALWVNLAD